MTGPSKVIVLDPDARSGRQIQLGFQREGVPAEIATVSGGRFELPTDDTGLVVVGGSDGQAVELVEKARSALEAGHADAPIVFAGRGASRGDLEAAGADEIVQQPAYLRDVVTVGRLLRGQPASQRRHLVGNLSEITGVLTLVRALSAIGRSAVLTLIRGLRRGEVRFYEGEVTSAQVGLIHGQAALHQLLLWTDARFDFHHEDVVRRQQIPLDHDELFADAERFLEGVRDASGTLSPSLVLEQDALRIGQLGKQIPTEVHGVLRMFDGHRVLADVLEDSPYRVFETLRVAQRAVDAGLLRRATPRGKATWRAVLAIEEWLVGAETRQDVIARGVVDNTAPVPKTEVTTGKVKKSRRQRKKRGANRPVSPAAVTTPSTTAATAIDWGALVPRTIAAEAGPLAGVVPAAQRSGEIILPAAPSRDEPREKLEALMDTRARERIFPTDLAEPNVVLDDTAAVALERAEAERAAAALEIAKRERERAEAEARQRADAEARAKAAAAEQTRLREEAQSKVRDLVARHRRESQEIEAIARAGEKRLREEDAAKAKAAALAEAARVAVDAEAKAKATADAAKAAADAQALVDANAAADAKAKADAANAPVDRNPAAGPTNVASAATAATDVEAHTDAAKVAAGGSNAIVDAGAKADAATAVGAKAVVADAAVADAKGAADTKAATAVGAKAVAASVVADAAVADAKGAADTKADAARTADAKGAADAKAAAASTAEAKGIAHAKADAAGVAAKAAAERVVADAAVADAAKVGVASTAVAVPSAANAGGDADAATAVAGAKAVAARVVADAAVADAKGAADAEADAARSADAKGVAAKAAADAARTADAKGAADAKAEAARTADAKGAADAKAAADAARTADAKGAADAKAAAARIADAKGVAAKAAANAAKAAAEAKAAAGARSRTTADSETPADGVAAIAMAAKTAGGNTAPAAPATSAAGEIDPIDNTDAWLRAAAEAKARADAEADADATALAARPAAAPSRSKPTTNSTDLVRALLEEERGPREVVTPLVIVEETPTASIGVRDRVSVTSTDQTARLVATPEAMVSEVPFLAVPIAQPKVPASSEDVSDDAITRTFVKPGAEPDELDDEPSDGVIRTKHTTPPEVPVPPPPPQVPVDDRPPQTTGEIRAIEKPAPSSARPGVVDEPSILVADLQAAHTAASTVAAVPPPTVNAATTQQATAAAAEIRDVRRDATGAFTQLEEEFFRAGQEHTGQTPRVPSTDDSFDDLDEGYQPVGFWDRLLGRKPKR